MSGMSLEDCIEAIESNYEYMLAYAAQGRDFEPKGGDGPPIRGALSTLRNGVAQIWEAAVTRVGSVPEPTRDSFSAFCDVLKADADRALRAVGLVLATGNVSSQLVDNLNASSHLRALLTDLFLLDEALKELPVTSAH